MTTLSVTGHMAISVASYPVVREALVKLLAPYAPALTGVSCLARGADTLFAEVTIELGGKLTVVVPARKYREQQVHPTHAPTFDRMVRAATEVVFMDYENASEQAYEHANKELLRRADRLVAIWNGSPSAGRGGTADVVADARNAGIAVTVLWPGGVTLEG